MRTSRVSIFTTTALLGLGTLISQAGPASAGPPKGPNTLEIAPTTTTTMQPLEAEEVGYCDLHLCIPADEVDPQDDLPIAVPPHVDPPIDDDLPIAQPDDPEDPECNPHQANCDEIGIPDPDDEDCDPKLGSCDLGIPDDESDCDPKLGSCDLGTNPGDPGDPGDGTDQGTDGGTQGGTDGGSRLPHTGMDLVDYLAAGVAITGLGLVLKRLGRRA